MAYSKFYERAYKSVQNHQNESMTIRREDNDVILLEMSGGARYKTGKFGMDNELSDEIINKTKKKWLVEWDEIRILGGEIWIEQDITLPNLPKPNDECIDKRELSDNERNVSKRFTRPDT